MDRIQETSSMCGDEPEGCRSIHTTVTCLDGFPVELKHIPRIFVWTTGVLGLVAALNRLIELPALVSSNPWQTLAAAAGAVFYPNRDPTSCSS